MLGGVNRGAPSPWKHLAQRSDGPHSYLGPPYGASSPGSSMSRAVSTHRKRRSSLRAVVILSGVLSLVAPVGQSHQVAGAAGTDAAGTDPAGTDPELIDTISLSGTQPTALAVYETGNKLYVADDNGEDLIVIDGATRDVITTIDVGGSVFNVVVNETYGKVFVASSDNAFTTGINEGNGLISVIDAENDTLITQIDPAASVSPGNAGDYGFGHDEVHDKLYFSYFCPSCGSLGVVDVATNAVTPIVYDADPFFNGVGIWRIEVNTVTNVAYFPRYGSNVVLAVDGTTLDATPLDLDSTGGSGPLDIAVNEIENKVYLTMISVPGQGQIGILILDRDTGGFAFAGAEDLEPLVFNPASNTLFSGVQVGQRGAVVDGASDELTYVDLGGEGMGDGAVNGSTDNAYFVSFDGTFVVNGSTLRHRAFLTGAPPEGGLVASSVVVDESRNLVYAVNDDETGTVSVFQDGAIPPPTLSIDDVQVNESSYSTSNVTFTVQLSEATGRDVSFDYRTSSGSARSGVDFTATSGTKMISAGSRTKTVTVRVRGDLRDEPKETFTLDLTNPANATIADGQALATIHDDDLRPYLEIRNAGTTEGDSGRHRVFFKVVLFERSGKTISTGFATVPRSATSPSDFDARSGTLSIAPGTKSKMIFVHVRGDRHNESNERFSVKLQNPVNARFIDRNGTGTIRDDD